MKTDTHHRISPGRWQLLLAVTTCIGTLSCAPTMTTDKPTSYAFEDPESTYLGRTAQAIADGHGEESGFLLLDRGRDALAWRLIFADAAEQSIDTQVFYGKTMRPARL